MQWSVRYCTKTVQSTCENDHVWQNGHNFCSDEANSKSRKTDKIAKNYLQTDAKIFKIEQLQRLLCQFFIDFDFSSETLYIWYVT